MCPPLDETTPERGDAHRCSGAKLGGLPESPIYSQRYKRVGVGALALRIGRHLRWRPADIDRWLDEQSEKARREAVG